jgi:hypothetical protein
MRRLQARVAPGHQPRGRAAREAVAPRAAVGTRSREQTIHGHRGRKSGPLYSARRALPTGADLLTDKQRDRLAALFADDQHVEVEATWGIYQRMIAAYREEDRRHGRDLMVKLIESVGQGVPKALSEVITLGRRLKKRAADVLAYFDRPGTSNGPTEAINGRLEHLRGSALGKSPETRFKIANDKPAESGRTRTLSVSPAARRHPHAPRSPGIGQRRNPDRGSRVGNRSRSEQRYMPMGRGHDVVGRPGAAEERRFGHGRGPYWARPTATGHRIDQTDGVRRRPTVINDPWESMGVSPVSGFS